MFKIVQLSQFLFWRHPEEAADEGSLELLDPSAFRLQDDAGLAPVYIPYE